MSSGSTGGGNAKTIISPYTSFGNIINECTCEKGNPLLIV